MDLNPSLKTIRIFISSPGDVAEERMKAREIFDRLQGEFSGVLQIAPYFWEHEPMLAHTDFQSQIEPPSRFDLFVCLLWARLGTRLYPGVHRKADGSEYNSGTEFELLDALEGFHKSGAPEVLVYKRLGDPIVPLEPKGEGERVLNQYYALQNFIASFTQKDGHFVVGTNSYRGLDQFEAKFEGDMRKVLQRYVPSGVAGSRIVPKTWMEGSPFRGLLHFDFEHAPVFFGRTRDISEVLDALRQQAAEARAFVLVFGGSGVGKSSLIRAGVLPWLVKPGVIDGVGLWRRAILRPSEVNEGDLFDALALALWHKDALPELGSDGTSTAQVAKMLREAPDGVGMLIKGVLSQAAREVQLAGKLEKQPRALCALVIDQLEELFTVERLADQREGFLRAIDVLARSGYVWVMATLRSDFYPRCEESPLLMELKKGAGQYHLRPPDEVQLGQMIRLPAAAAGLLFEENRETGRRLDDVLRDAALASPSSLPLLEFALEELYLKRDVDHGLLLLEAYNAMGGVEGALGKRAEESFQKTGAGAQESFNRVFRKLVTVNINEDAPAVRRRALKDEIATEAGSRELINQLVADRLLVADRTEENAVVVSVAHEAMLTSWPRLKEWIASHRQSLKSHAEVTADTKRWLESKRNPDYLYQSGQPLDQARDVLEAGFLNKEEEEFVRASLRKVAKQQFRDSLATGEQMLEVSGQLRASYPDLCQQVLREALTSGNEETRAHAATLLGMEPVEELTRELEALVLKDPANAVRWTAAASLIQLDHSAYFDDLIQQLGEGAGSEVIRALAHIRAAADAVETPTSFEPRFRELSSGLRARVTSQSRRLRLKRDWPTLLVVVSLAVTLSSIFAAIFKSFPGAFNYALCQAAASAPTGFFQAVVACFFWGGLITLAIAFHRVVYRSALGKKSYLQPWTALVAGAIGGVISSALLLLIMALVCDVHGTMALGWTEADWHSDWGRFWGDTLWRTRAFWPYMIMGTGLGIGMAAMVNGLRASKEWSDFIGKQSILTGMEALSLIKALSKLMLRFAWPIPVCMFLADVLAFYVVRTAPGAIPMPAWIGTWNTALLGGLTHDEHLLREWKMSAWGQGLGIAFDSITQSLGGFFCIVGMGLGLIVIRYGLKIEPRKN